jgi:hypothetical protein|nr:MAG TPA: hypothetical protein [Caudoviricetes sp.]
MDVLKVTKKSGAVVSLPAPDELKWSISDLDADGTGRNQNGDMFRDRVAVKRKLECSWRPLGSAEMAKLLQSVDDVFFRLTYPDAMTGTDRTMTCYVGDRSSPIMQPETDGKWLWGGLSMNFVER